jgi:Ala-tRNA(Pro) deacylase
MTALAGALVDGSLPQTPQQFLTALADWGIQAKTIRHPAVFTVEEAKTLRGNLHGCHTKNLFLRNKKGKMWLFTCPEDRAVDLKSLGETVGVGRFSFASQDRLMKYLGLTAGSVTPFGLINDRTGAVGFVLDRAILQHEILNFHPLINTMTTAIRRADFLSVMETIGHAPLLI